MEEQREKYINPFTDYGFKRLFEVAEIAKFSPEEVQAYQESLKSYRDLKNSLDTAREEGIEIVLQVLELAKQGKDVNEITMQARISKERVLEILKKINER